MHVVRVDDKVLDLNAKLYSLLSEQDFKVGSNLVGKHGKSVLRAPDKVIVQVTNPARCMPIIQAMTIRERLDKDNLSNAEGGARGFLRQLKQTVPPRDF